MNYIKWEYIRDNFHINSFPNELLRNLDDYLYFIFLDEILTINENEFNELRFEIK